MSHVHALIRDAAATALTGLATTGSHVFANRLFALADSELPGLRVFTDAEQVEYDTVHRPAAQSREFALVVECCAKADSASLDDTCDQMQLEVENALYAGISVDGKTIYPVLQSSQYDDAIGLTPVAVKRVVFSVSVNTLANAPDHLI